MKVSAGEAVPFEVFKWSAEGAVLIGLYMKNSWDGMAKRRGTKLVVSVAEGLSYRTSGFDRG